MQQPIQGKDEPSLRVPTAGDVTSNAEVSSLTQQRETTREETRVTLGYEKTTQGENQRIEGDQPYDVDNKVYINEENLGGGDGFFTIPFIEGLPIETLAQVDPPAKEESQSDQDATITEPTHEELATSRHLEGPPTDPTITLAKATSASATADAEANQIKDPTVSVTNEES